MFPFVFQRGEEASYMVLSKQSSTDPVEGCTPNSRQLRPNASGCNGTLVRVMNCVSMPMLHERHIERGKHQFGVQMAIRRETAKFCAASRCESGNRLRRTRDIKHPVHAVFDATADAFIDPAKRLWVAGVPTCLRLSSND